MADWEDFGQKVDLTARIREILVNYPEGTPILKESIQNADDARAGRIAFCLDHRQHRTDALLADTMAPFQGPALLVFNDSVFSEADFSSISRIGDSVKREEAGKTGRFGIGFNSCYHITDVPSFVSGSHLVIFDPHCTNLPNISSANPGKKINFVEAAGRAAARACAGQLAPYQGAFGCDLTSGKPWHGTLFRFPLRTAQLAACSNISKQAYDQAKVQDLLRQLCDEAPTILLFLKSVAVIEVLEWHEGQSAPTPCFRASVSNMSPQLAQERSLFTRVSAQARQAATVSAVAAGGQHADITAQLHLQAYSGSHAPSPPAAASTFVLDIDAQHLGAIGGKVGTTGGSIRRSTFLVSQVCAGGPTAALAAELSRQFAVPLVPWAAIAADITPPEQQEEREHSEVASGAKLQGRAFCFLPLPATTGLPVHVNAFFELSSNRRDIWYGEDMAGVGAKRAQWNMLLLKEVAAGAYARLLVAAASLLGAPARLHTYMSLLPDHDVPQPYQALVTGLYSALATGAYPTLYTPAQGGAWLPPAQVLLPDSTCHEDPRLGPAIIKAGLPLASGVTAGLAEIMTRHMAQPPLAAPAGLASQQQQQQRSHGSHTQQPHQVHSAAPPRQQGAGAPMYVTPAAVRAALQGLSPSQQAAALDVPSDAPALLGYCLQGVPLDAPQKAAQQLSGLCLLPLLDGSLGTLAPLGTEGTASQAGRVPGAVHSSSAGTARCLYLPDELELQLLGPHVGSLLLDTAHLGDTVVSQLYALAQLRALTLCLLDTAAMARHVLPRLLPPAAALAAAGGSIPWGPREGVLTREWVSLLWRWLSRQSSLSHFVGLPVLPVLPHHLVPLPDRARSTAISTGSAQLLEQVIGSSGDDAAKATHPDPPAVQHDAQQAAAVASGAESAAAEALSTEEGQEAQQGQVEAGQQQPPAEVVVLRVLRHVGVDLVDHMSFMDVFPPQPLLQAHCHALDGAGVLAALINLAAMLPHILEQRPRHQSSSGSGQHQGSRIAYHGPGTTSSKGSRWEQAFQGLSAAERGALRSFLLTEETIQGAARLAAGNQSVYRAMLATLAALPIYEAPPTTLMEQQQAVGEQEQGMSTGDGARGQQQGASGAEPHMIAISDGDTSRAPQPCYLLPEGFQPVELPQKYILGGSSTATRILVQYLGVKPITLSEALKQHVLPLLGTLSPGARDSHMLAAVTSLPHLMREDPGIVALLRTTPFLPTPAGGRSSLKPPPALYDPRVPDLVALLDPRSFFPSEPWASNELALSMLTSHLGLRAVAGRDTVLEAAHYVQRLADKAARQQAKADGPKMDDDDEEGGMDMVVARGKALLAYLELEAGRLSAPGEGGLLLSAAARKLPGGQQQSQTQQKGRLGFFSRVTELFQGPGGAGGSREGGRVSGSGGAAGDDAAAQEAQEIHRFWAELSSTRWCPVLVDPPEPGLPWPLLNTQPGGVNTTTQSAGGQPGSGTGSSVSVPRPSPLPCVTAPRLARPLGDLWLVSASLRILDGECRSSALSSGLGWSTPLGGSILAHQLLCLGEMHRSIQGDQPLAKVLAGVVPQLYRVLSDLPAPESEAARSRLHGSCCVFVGTGFVEASRVALQGSLDLSPFLYVLPAELSPFKDLLLQFGATPTFSTHQYMSLLEDMYLSSLETPEGTPPPPPNDAPPASDAAAGQQIPQQQPRPLDSQQLAQAIAVVQALADMSAPAFGTRPLYVPDERGVLTKAGELAFNDAPWMGVVSAPGSATSAATTRLVHPKISNLTAERVGVSSLRRRLLAAAADTLSLGIAPGLPGATEAFGQSEALTTRLRHIISDYPEGPGVLMELLQNADDAGASRLCLMLDAVQYPTDSVLGPAMAIWQGPALLAFNDALFSPSDFSAIARIGQDSKMGKAASIGRFGLGFNAVYHLTDLPTFVSGENIVMFDPSARYLPGISAAQPGLRIAFQRANLLSQFPDALAPFLHFGCTLKEPFSGTLFRFPLRGTQAAAQSDIKPGVATSPADVLSLLSLFQAQLPQALLFLKSVRRVEVYARCDKGSPPCLLFTAGATPCPGVTSPATALTLSASAASTTALSTGQQQQSQQQQPSLQAPILRFISEATGSGGQQDLQRLVKKLSTTSPEALPHEIAIARLSLATNSEAFTSVASAMGAEQLANAAMGLATKATEEAWLVCNGLTGGNARDMAVRAGNTTGVKMIPWVGVAARFSQSSHAHTEAAPDAAAQPAADGAVVSQQGGDLSVQAAKPSVSGGGQAFCFLPLPVRTGLPVHVNAFFELSSNRRDIWHGTDMAGAGARRAAWNLALMQDGLAPAYARLLVEMSAELGPTEALFRLFPTLPSPEPWSALVRSFYGQLAERPLVWCDAQGGRWLPPSQAVLADGVCHSSTHGLKALLSALGLPIACHMPRHIELAILEMTPGSHRLTPSLVRRHLQQAVKRAGGAGGRGLAALIQQLLQPTNNLGNSDMSSSTSVPPGGQKQPAVAAVAPPSPAAVLLEYCLSDAEPPSGSSQQQAAAHLTQLQGELEGLPLLPLADGTLGIISPSPPKRTSGASAQQQPQQQAQLPSSPCYILPASPQEQSLLAGTPGLVISPALPADLRARLQALAQQQGGVLNVQALSAAALNSLVLPRLLPPEWRGKEVVPWTPTQAGGGGGLHQAQLQGNAAPPGPAMPSAAASAASLTVPWLRQLWQWLGSHQGGAEVLGITDWPLLPLQGGRLAAIRSPSQVLRAGDEWQEQVTSALVKLGCQLLDASVLEAPPAAADSAQPLTQPQDSTATAAQSAGHIQVTVQPAPAPSPSPPPPSASPPVGFSVATNPALAQVVQSPSLQGVLCALEAAAGTAMTTAAEVRTAQGVGTWQQGKGQNQHQYAEAASVQRSSAQSQAAWAQKLATLTAGERRQLRAYMLQARWFGGGATPLPPHLLPILKALPIFEVHQDLTVVSSPTKPAASLLGEHQASCSLFVSLTAQQLYLPPPDVDASLLGPLFVKCDSEREEQLMESHLDVPRMGIADFIGRCVLEKAASGSLPPGALDALLVRVLRRLAARGDKPPSAAESELREGLRTWPIFPLQGPSSVSPPSAAPPPGQQGSAVTHQRRLVPVTSLFDPRVPAFKQLLDPASHFPGAPLDRDEQLLDVMVGLGMRREVTLQVLATAAVALHKAHQQYTQGQPPESHGTTGQELRARGAALLKYLGDWAATSAPRLHGAHRSHQVPASQHPHVSQPPAAPGSSWVSALSDSDQAALAQLQSAVWCPVVTQCPEPGLPWPSSQPLLAAPRLMRPASDAWVCSATLHLVDTSVPITPAPTPQQTPQQSRGPDAGVTAAPAVSAVSASPRRAGTALPDSLCAAMGWSDTPRTSVVCAQLLELGRRHALVPQLSSPPPREQQPSPASEGGASTEAQGAGASSSRGSEAGSQAGGQEVADLLGDEVPVQPPAAADSGAHADAQGPQAQAEQQQQQEEVKVDPARVEAGAMQVYSLLSSALEGPEVDLVTMSFERADVPAVWVGKGFVLPSRAALVSDVDVAPWLHRVPTHLQHNYLRLLGVLGVRERFSSEHYAGALRDMASAAAAAEGGDGHKGGGAGRPLGDGDLEVALQLADCLADAQQAHGRPPGVPVYLPDSRACMVPAVELFFNDAEWLSSEGTRLVHPALPHATAELLGVRSLRYRQQQADTHTSTQLDCPHPAAIQEALFGAQAQALSSSTSSAAPPLAAGPASVLAFLAELQECVDLLGVTKVQVTLDTRQHPAQSLLHPGLARFQGPALCIVIPGLVLGADEMSELLATSHTAAGPPPPTRRVHHHSPGQGSNLGVLRSRGRGGAPVGLMSAFAVTEVVQMISGSVTGMWDPAGRQLTHSAQEEASGEAAGMPRGKLYRHVGSDLTTVFADQFSTAWEFGGGYDVRSHVNATLLRLPLSPASHLFASAGRGAQLPPLGFSTASLEAVTSALTTYADTLAGHSLLFCRTLMGLSVSLIPSDPGSSPRLLCQTVTTCVSPSLTRHNLGAPHWSTSSTGSTSDPSKAHGGGGGLPGFGKSLLNAALSIGRHGPGQPAPGSRSGPSVDRHATLLELVSVKEGDTGYSRERWLVSTFWADGAAVQRASGGGTSGGSAPRDVISAIAVCLSRSESAPAAAGKAQGSETRSGSGGGEGEKPPQGPVPVSGLFLPLFSPTQSPSPLSAAPAAVLASNTRVSGDATVAAGNTASGAGSSAAFGSAPPPASSGHKKPGPGNALGGLPFLVSGSFHLVRGRDGCPRILHAPSLSRAQDPVSLDSGNTPRLSPPGAAAPQPQQHAASSSREAPLESGVIPAHIQQRSAHNIKVAQGIASAWLVALYWMTGLVPPQSSSSSSEGTSIASVLEALPAFVGPEAAVYQVLLPDAQPAVQAEDEVALSALRALYTHASRLPLWRLRSGQRVTLQEGIFYSLPHTSPSSPTVPARVSQGGQAASNVTGGAPPAQQEGPAAGSDNSSAPSMGPAAQAYVLRHLPIFNDSIPSWAAPSLQACGLSGVVRVMSPAVARPALVALLARAGTQQHPHQHHQHHLRPASAGATGPGVPTVLESCELLAYCMSDVLLPPEEPRQDGEQSPPLAAAAASGGTATTIAGAVQGTASNSSSRAAAGSNATPTGTGAAAAGGVDPLSGPGSVMDELGSLVGAATNELQALFRGLDHMLTNAGGAGGGAPGLGLLGSSGAGGGAGAQGQPAGGAPAAGARAGGSTTGSTPPSQHQQHAQSGTSSSRVGTSTSPQQGVAGEPASSGPRVNTPALRACKGLPVPTASGVVIALGSEPLVVIPPECGPTPVALLPPRCAREFLHPAAVTALLQVRVASGAGSAGPQASAPGVADRRDRPLATSQPAAGVHTLVIRTMDTSAPAAGPNTSSGGTTQSGSHHLLQDPSVREALSLRLYSLKDLSRHLSEILPSSWARPGVTSPASGWDIPGSAPPDASSAVQGLGLRALGLLGASGPQQGSRGPAQGQAGNVPFRGGAVPAPGTRVMANARAAGGSHGLSIMGVRGMESAGSGQVVDVLTFPQMGVEWGNGDAEGPMPQWLGRLFILIMGLAQVAPVWRAPEVRLSDLDAWPLLPTLGGKQLVYMAHRALLLALPAPFLAQAYAQQQQQQMASRDAGQQAPAGGEEAGSGGWLPGSAPVGVEDLAVTGSTWSRLLPSLHAAGVPILDPRFVALVARLCVPHVDLDGTFAAVGLLKKMRWASEVLGPGVMQGAAVARWTQEHRGHLLQMLADNLPSSLSQEEISFLRSLPLYKTLDGTVVALEGGDWSPHTPSFMAAAAADGLAACPASVLDEVPGLLESLPPEYRGGLLEHRPQWERLLGLLGVPVLTLASLLARSVVPVLTSLPDQAQALVLTVIQARWQAGLKSEAGLVEALKDCPFVPCDPPPSFQPDLLSDALVIQQQGAPVYRRPPECLDPAQPVFAKVYRHAGLFPSSQFAYPAWLEVLRDCGLQSTLTAPTFLAAAQHVEGQGHVLGPHSRAPSAERASVLDAAEALVEHLAENSHTLVGRDFWSSLAQVAFIPATLGIPGSPHTTRVLAKYAEASAPRDWPLIWTTLPVISPRRGGQTLQVPSTIGAAFRLRSPPPFASVLQHLRNISQGGGEDMLGSWPSASGLAVEAAFNQILGYLQREGLSDDKLNQLKPIAFIPVANATRLVPPSSLFLRLKEDLAPFGYEVPSAFASHLELLRSLGAREEPGAQWLLDTLVATRAAAGHTPLNVNQRAAALRVLAALHARRTSGADATLIASAKSSGRLLVLAADGRLVEAHRGVTIASGAGRLLGRIDARQLTFVHPQVPSSICSWLGCPELHDMVQEVLDPGQQLEEVAAVGGLSLQEARTALASVPLVQAAYSAVQAHAGTVKGLQPLSLQQVAAVLRPLAQRLTFVRTLATCVVLKASGRNITRPGDTAAARVYEFACSRTGRQYIAEPPEGLPVGWLLAAAASRAVGSPVTLPLHPFFMVTSAEAMQALQPVLLPGGYDPQLEAAAQAGELGTPLLPSDAALLQLKPLRRFCAHELVAYSRATILPLLPANSNSNQQQQLAGPGPTSLLLPPPTTAAAAAAARRAAATTAGAAGSNLPDGSSDQGTTSTTTATIGTFDGGSAAPPSPVPTDLLYGRVTVNAEPAGDTPLYRVHVEVEPGVVVPLLSTQVWCFRTPTAADTPGTGQGVGGHDLGATGAGAAALGSGASGSHRVLGMQSQDEGSSGASTTTAAAAAASAPSSSAPSAATAAPPVGPPELVSAVKELLGAAGLPLDLGRQQLLEQATELQAALRTSKGALEEAQAAAAAHQAELEAARSAWSCKICFTRDVDAAFGGCGHMVCVTCASGLDRCPVCRKRSALIRLYK